MKALTLNGYQIRCLVEMAGDDDETEISIAEFGEDTDQETGDKMPAGLYAYYTDYPEEGRVRLFESAPPQTDANTGGEKNDS